VHRPVHFDSRKNEVSKNNGPSLPRENGNTVNVVDLDTPGGVKENPLKRCLKGVKGMDTDTPGRGWICLSVTGLCHSTNICEN
jgi:hypothetical protein